MSTTEHFNRDRPGFATDEVSADALDLAIDSALETHPVTSLPSGFVAATMVRVAAASPVDAAPGRATAGDRNGPAWAPSAWEFALPVALVGVLLATIWQLWALLQLPPAVDPRLMAEIQWNVLEVWSRWAAALTLSPTALLVVVVGTAALIATALSRIGGDLSVRG